ncbi:MAG: hypothetical protein QXE81_00475, partial [Desulfurococcaceae archaeon]
MARGGKYYLLLRDFYRIVSIDINPYLEGFAVSHRYYIIPPEVKEESFIEDSMEIVERGEVDLIIPILDEEIEVLSRNT